MDTKILWMKNHEPEKLGAYKTFLPPNDYVIYKMTGEIAIDYSFSAGNIGGIFDSEYPRTWSEGAVKCNGNPDVYDASENCGIYRYCRRADEKKLLTSWDCARDAGDRKWD